MTDVQQGYAGQQGLTDDTSEFNRVSFVVSQIIGRKATMKLVQVKAVTNDGGVSAVGFVDVMPLVNQVDGLGNSTQQGIVFGLPYFRLQGGTNAVIMDPQVGDIGLAVVADRDISAVKATKAQANPGSKRQMDLADGVYVGGILNGVPEQYIRFSAGLIEMVSPTKVRIAAPEIELDGAVTATGEIVGGATGISLTTHVHVSASPGSNTSAPVP